MIEVKVFALENFAAILASISIPLENVVTGEFNFFFGQPVEHNQQNHSGNPDLKRDSVDGFGVWFLMRKILPLAKVECLKTSIIIAQNDISVAFKNER